MTNLEAANIINDYCFDECLIGNIGAALNLAILALNHSASDSEDTIKHDYKEDCIKFAKEVGDLRTENTELKNLIIELSKKLVRSDIL
jgi:hypothetical protein